MSPIINAVATAVPEHRISQSDVRDRVAAAMPSGMPDRMARIYDSTGIDARFIIQPAEDYITGQQWPDRNLVYLQQGQVLLEIAAKKALDQAGLAPTDIDQIVMVSSTGIATPSMPTQMLAPMGFRPETQILPLFGYGCAGGVISLGVASDLVRADDSRRVLLLCLELCSLAFRYGDTSKQAIIASTLFADGASAMVISGNGTGPKLGAFGQHSWPGTRSMMGWDIDTMGLSLILSRDIPSFVAKEFAPVIDRFLDKQGIAKSALCEPACHPGGRKVIEALEQYFDHLPDGLQATRDVLRAHGNMSSPTVHFVLERRLQQGLDGPLLMTALGPGFTGAMGLITP